MPTDGGGIWYNTTMAKATTEGECHLYQDYETNGVVGPIEILTREEAAECLAKLEAWLEHDLQFDGSKPLGNQRFKPHLYLPFLNDVVHHPALITAVQKILKTDDIRCWSSDLNMKDPHSNGVYCPHQDGTYTGLNPAQECVTVWIALSDVVSKHEGCLEFYYGSHALGQLAHAEDDYEEGEVEDGTLDGDSPDDKGRYVRRKNNNLLSRRQYLPNVPQDAPVAVPLVGGQATMHHFHTIHQSGPNHSGNRRTGLAIRYMTARVQQMGRVRESVTWVSGIRGTADSCEGYFDWEPILPSEQNVTAEDIERGRRAHTDAMQREAVNYFESSKSSAYDEVLATPS